MTLKLTLSTAALMAIAGPAVADIDLEFRPATASVFVGDTVSIELYAKSDNAFVQPLSALQAVFSWDDALLQLVGLDDTGDLFVSSLPGGDPFGLNEADPPQDGDGFYMAFADLGNPLFATPVGTLITTFEFVALAPTPATPIDLLSDGGVGGQTVVYDGMIPNLDVTGTLSGSTVEILPVPAPSALALVVMAVGVRRRRR